MKNKTAVICLSKVNGGMELAAVKLARLLSQNMEIDFFARDGGFIEKYRDDNFTSYNIKLHTLKFKSNFSFSLILQAREIIKSRQIKNIIFLGASEMKSLYFSCYGLDINFIIRQGSRKTTSKKDFLHRLFYSNVSHFIGNCEYIKQNILDILPIPAAASVDRIYSSLNIDKGIEQHTFKDKVNIVLVGRVHPFKGQLEAIKACEILHESNIDFSLKFLGDIQDKEYFKEIESFMLGCKYKEKIEFVGYTTKIKSYLLQSDVFLFPSLGEGMSNAIIESLGYGLVSLIYDDTSSPEFKELGFHIHLTDENSVDELKKKLLYIAKNIKLEKEKALKNISLTQDIFASKREKEEYLELLI